MTVIANNCRVAIHYTLTRPNGDIIESSRNGHPLNYIHGHETLVPGLEKALMGKMAGDRVAVSLSPEEGYGERSDNLIHRLPRDIFESNDAIENGMRFQAETGRGVELVTVIDSDEESITIDANHPLAGETLNFDVDVIAVAAAPEKS